MHANLRCGSGKSAADALLSATVGMENSTLDLDKLIAEFSTWEEVILRHEVNFITHNLNPKFPSAQQSYWKVTSSWVVN